MPKYKLSTMADADWPFDLPQNCASFTLRSIVFDGSPMLYVSHDADDHGWQFLDGKPIDIANGALVGLGTIVRHDPSVLELADMPPGWSATRETKDSPWRRVPPDGG
jgi:hypothetical protein